MNVTDIKRLTDEGIILWEQYIDTEQGRAEFWQKLFGSEKGDFVLREFKDRLKLVMQLYATIPPGSPEATHLLAGIQAQEYEIREWINRIGDSTSHPERLNNMREALRAELKRRSEGRAGTQNTYVPSDHKMEKHK